MVNKTGQPVEFFLTPNSSHGEDCFPWFDVDIPSGPTVFADMSYNLDWLEDVLKEVGMELLTIRKQNSKRALPPWMSYLYHLYRKAVETVGSLGYRRLLYHIHAVTSACFELKVTLFVLALSFSYVFEVAT